MMYNFFLLFLGLLELDNLINISRLDFFFMQYKLVLHKCSHNILNNYIRSYKYYHILFRWDGFF